MSHWSERAQATANQSMGAGAVASPVLDCETRDWEPLAEVEELPTWEPMLEVLGEPDPVQADVLTVDDSAQAAPAAPPGGDAQTPPPPVHWIEIGLVDEDGRPMPGVDYELTLPDGKRAQGKLDEHGKARVEDIAAPGDAQISFPTLDTDAWVPFT